MKILCNEVSNPQNDQVWEKMAAVLEIKYGESVYREMAFNLAMTVLSDDTCTTGTRQMALGIVREISKKYL